jgi:hypothetical protein
MNAADRFKLRFGPYRMSKCKVGKLLRCVIRGEKKVVGISDAPIPWLDAARLAEGLRPKSGALGIY